MLMEPAKRKNCWWMAMLLLAHRAAATRPPPRHHNLPHYTSRGGGDASKDTVVVLPGNDDAKCKTKNPLWWCRMESDSPNLHPAPPPEIPFKTLDDYRIVRQIGAGKFSEVFEAEAVEAPKERDEKVLEDPPNPDYMEPDNLVVLKCLKPNPSANKIRREIHILHRIRHLPNVVRLLAVVVPQYDETQSTSATTTQMSLDPLMPILVMQHAGANCQFLCHPRRTTSGKHHRHKNEDAHSKARQRHATAEPPLSPYEIRYYMLHLLVALEAMHARGIMHRDVKPRNVMINRRQHTLHNGRRHVAETPSNKKSDDDTLPTQPPLVVVDLGLAETCEPRRRYSARVASRHYKSPELLLGFHYYDYAVDLWAAGCVLGALLKPPSGRAREGEPYFYGRDNLDQLATIVKSLGNVDALMDYIEKHQIKLAKDVQDVLAQCTEKSLERDANEDYDSCDSEDSDDSDDGSDKEVDGFQEQGRDLLRHLLVYDHDLRWTAKQAMEHTFFDPVRERVKAEVRHYYGECECH